MNRQRQEGQNIIASLSDSVHTDTVTGVTTRCENVGFILNKACHVDNVSLGMFLSSSFVVGVVETHSDSGSTRLSVESHFSNIPPALVFSQRFVERQFHGDRGTSPA